MRKLGHASEDETGMIYMQARYYDPAMGRFVSEDPNYSGSNWYRYCGNNPVNKSDPSGKIELDFTTIWQVLSALWDNGSSLDQIAEALIKRAQVLEYMAQSRQDEETTLFAMAEPWKDKALEADDLARKAAYESVYALTMENAKNRETESMTIRFEAYKLRVLAACLTGPLSFL